MSTWKVLLVEDDPMVREVNRQFIERVEGFEVIDTASNGLIGLEKMKVLVPDLVFIDIFMPELDGIETLSILRQQNLAIDVICVTAANDVQTIQRILHLGAFDYIMKPFTFERIEKTLHNYRRWKSQLAAEDELSQQALDQIINKEQAYEGQVKVDMIDELPKGFNKATLNKVLKFLQEKKTGASADEVSANIGIARVTARRYLDYMEKQQLIRVDIQYGSVGRPINQYFI